MKEICASCYKEFEPWNVILLKPRYQESMNMVIPSLICRDCAKEEIEKGIIKEAKKRVLRKGFNKVKVVLTKYEKT